MPDEMAVVAARDLVKDYVTGSMSIRALDGVTLAVPRARFLSIMGPSGSGKSTLLHLLGGLDRPTKGDVLLEGRALSGMRDKQLTLTRRKRFGFVFQFFNLIPVLSVEENIALPLLIAGARPAASRAPLDRMIDLVGLGDVRSKLPSQISGGQQQRTAVARALVTEPAVLLADEPTGNLDTRNGLAILALLKQAQAELGQTIVMVTHDARAAAYADEVVLLRDGRLTDRLDIEADLATTTTKRSSARVHVGGDDRANAVLAWLQAAGA